MNCGVYQIKNKTSGSIYVGSSVNIKQRWRLHRFHLNRGTHDSKWLQNSWSKNGSDAFEFTMLVVCSKEMVLFYEQLLIDGLNPAYNTLKVAGSRLGHKVSDKTKSLMSAAQRASRKKYDWKGQRLCLSDIAETEGFDVGVLISRVNGLGMTVEKALAQEKRIWRHEFNHDGRTQTIKQWASELGMHPRRLACWTDSGMSIGDCLSRLAREEKRLSFSQFCKHAGVNLRTVKSRVRNGMGVMDAIATPSRKIDTSWRVKESVNG